MELRLLAFAASLRQASLNRKLIEVATGIARALGASVDLADFREFDMPLFDGDIQARDGPPPGAHEFKRRLDAADGLLLASPEYNYSIPGTLKNAIDWVSRFRPVPFRRKSAMLLSTSAGLVGGNRCLWALRVPLESLGMHVYPDMFSLAQGDKALDSSGALADAAARERLEKMIGGYISAAGALAGARAS
jgi:chromate reductase, NAD(P)H dehydrogenase (quinone)